MLSGGISTHTHKKLFPIISAIEPHETKIGFPDQILS